MIRIPIRNKDGLVVAETIIDDAMIALSGYSWCLNRWGYAVRYQRYGKGRRHAIALHRVVIGAVNGQMVDHINRDRLDNQMQNLRFCTKSTNGMNRGPQKNSRSGIKGVYWHGQAGKWGVRFIENGKSHSLGLYFSKEEAALVAKARVSEFHGAFAFQEST